MKQDEEEWKEYQKVMEDVVKWSGLDKNIFYDLRGNHDNFGVPVVGGSFDFFSKYSINGQLGRSGKVNSVTLQVSRFPLYLINIICCHVSHPIFYSDTINDSQILCPIPTWLQQLNLWLKVTPKVFMSLLFDQVWPDFVVIIIILEFVA